MGNRKKSRDKRFAVLEGKARPSDIPTQPAPVTKLKPPVWLSKEAKKWIKKNSSELLSSGAVTQLDLPALWVFATIGGRIEKLERQINETGELIPSGKNKLIKNPLLSVLQSSIAEYRRFSEAFGMIPLGRDRVMTKVKKKTRNKMADLID